MKQLISYIAPAAPATRRLATGQEADMRLEIGFTPNWYRNRTGIDFGEQWHNDPAYRKQTVAAMRSTLLSVFPGMNIGAMSDKPDLLTGIYGACTVAAIYGIPIIYSQNNWPNCAAKHLNDLEIEKLQPPVLESNAFFEKLIRQLEWIHHDQGSIIGFINWQGVLNNAHRLRGEELFTDMFTRPELTLHLMDCVCDTMIDACRRIRHMQELSGESYNFFTVSNCLVNMISPEQYRDFVMPYDLRIAEAFELFGIHNCAWNADHYLEYYAQVNNLGYIDMGILSDLGKARKLFPEARRAVMYTPMDLSSKSIDSIRSDMIRIAKDYAPCDIVVADIETSVPDEKVKALYGIVHELNSPNNYYQ
jgi:hypothetical protein